MAFNLRCSSQLMTETVLSVLNAQLVEHKQIQDVICIPVYTPSQSGDDPETTMVTPVHFLDFNLQNSMNCPFHPRSITLGQNILGWAFITDHDTEQCHKIIKSLTQLSILKREVPLLRTFARLPNTPEHTPAPTTHSILAIGRETGFGNLAAIIPEDFEIIGAYQDSVALDYLHAKQFDGIILEREGLDIRDIRILHTLQMHPEFAKIPVFIKGFFEFDESVYLQKLGISLICPNSWPTPVVQNAIGNIVRFSAHYSALKQEVRQFKNHSPTPQARLFSPMNERLFMASLETRLKLSRQGLPRGTALIMDISLHYNHQPEPALERTTEAHYSISKQILDLIQHLTRSEDQVFALSENRFAIVLPGTTSEDAMVAGGRFKAILETSRFRATTPHDAPFTAQQDEIYTQVKCHVIPLDMESLKSSVR